MAIEKMPSNRFCILADGILAPLVSGMAAPLGEPRYVLIRPSSLASQLLENRRVLQGRDVLYDRVSLGQRA